jgi:hypothetical protein
MDGRKGQAVQRPLPLFALLRNWRINQYLP